MKTTYFIVGLQFLSVLAAPVVSGRSEDTDSLLVRVYVTDDGKIVRRSDADTDIIRILVADDTDNKKIRRSDADTDVIAIEPTNPFSVYVADDEKLSSRKLISPYTDDVEAADPVKVLGE